MTIIKIGAAPLISYHLMFIKKWHLIYCCDYEPFWGALFLSEGFKNGICHAFSSCTGQCKVDTLPKNTSTNEINLVCHFLRIEKLEINKTRDFGISTLCYSEWGWQKLSQTTDEKSNCWKITTSRIVISKFFINGKISSKQLNLFFQTFGFKWKFFF